MSRAMPPPGKVSQVEHGMNGMNAAGDSSFSPVMREAEQARLARVELFVTQMLDKQIEVISYCSRMEWALSLLVKIAPEMLKGLTEINHRDEALHADIRNTVVASIAEAQTPGRQSVTLANDVKPTGSVAPSLSFMPLDASQPLQDWPGSPSNSPAKLDHHSDAARALASDISGVLTQQVRAAIKEMEHSVHPRSPKKSRRKGFGTALYSDSGHDSAQILEIISKGDIQKLQEHVSRGLDVNKEFQSVTVGTRHHTHCSLVAAAVHTGNQEMVELLVSNGANADSQYGFLAGSTQMKWCGQASLIAVTKGDMRMLQYLLTAKANPHAVASNKANLLWQAAYSGKEEILDYLLDFDVDLETAAESQDKVGVSYTPLHVGIISGNEKCVRYLLEASAAMNYKNAENASPLDDAIRTCQPQMVQMLVSAGAYLTRPVGNEEDQVVMSPSATSTYQQCTTALKILLLKRNPVLVHAAAVGLQDQPDQVKLLTCADILGFLECGPTKVELLTALFAKCKLKFRGGRQEVIELKTAQLGEYARTIRNFPAFPHVVLSKHTYADMVNRFKRREQPEPTMQALINCLAPQEQDTSCHAVERHHTSIKVYECLVAGIQDDLRIVQSLADCSRFDRIWLEISCQAIFRSGWMRIRFYAMVEVIVHVLLLYIFVYISYLLQKQTPDSKFIDLSASSRIHICATFGIPLWIYEFAKELVEFLVHVDHGWASSYVSERANLMDWCRIIADGIILIQFISYDKNQPDSFWFRVWFGGCCFLKWTKAVYSLAPFRSFGLQVLPILFTMSDIGPFVVIMSCYLAGVGHALIASDFMQLDFKTTFLNAVFFGMSGDPAKIWVLYAPETPKYDHEEWLKAFLVLLVSFCIPITLMNIFIAALSNSYCHAIDHMEHLYQHRRAGSVFSHSALLYAVFERIPCCKRFASQIPAYGASRRELYLWFANNHEKFYKSAGHHGRSSPTHERNVGKAKTEVDFKSVNKLQSKETRSF